MKRLTLLAAISGALLVGLWLGVRPEPQPRAEAQQPVEPDAEVRVRASAPRPAQPMLVSGGVDRTEVELAYAKAFASGQTPGVAAFRITSDAYVDYNMEEAKALAEKEGMTLGEIRELTYFGHLAMRSQHWNDVQELLGLELTDEQKHNAEELLYASNAEFKLRMRELVANGASEAERWELIRSTQESYLNEYFAITGVNEHTLDRLLGGDFGGRARAPALVSAEHTDNLLADVNTHRNPNPEGIGHRDDGE